MNQDKNKKTRCTSTWYPWIEIGGWRMKAQIFYTLRFLDAQEEAIVSEARSRSNKNRRITEVHSWNGASKYFSFREGLPRNLYDSQCSTVKWKKIYISTSCGQNHVSSGLRLQFKSSPDANSTRSWSVNNDSRYATQPRRYPPRSDIFYNFIVQLIKDEGE